ncbi:MAG: hypothetical protein HYW51_01615 [Candidatus Doudnabacteria bacterium]|nr:hypothetical protein [Candidatus Doudnabacteria bacterium]
MPKHLLVIYEIALKAARVTNKKTYREFERWVRRVINECKDAAVERVARIHLIRLQQQFSM